MGQGDIMNGKSTAERQIIITKLLSGKATQEERDVAIATVMMSLWTQDDLKSLIRMVHKDECEACPLRIRGTNPDPDGPWQKLCLSLVKYGGWLIGIISTLVAYYTKA